VYTERCIVFAIDAEPDGRKRIQGDEWEGTQVALRELAQLRSRIEELSQTPVRLNWFLRFDPQIEATWGRPDWVLEAWPSLIQWIERYGDFTGIHTHFWKWNDHRREWFNDFGDPGWRAECVRRGVEGYRSVFGVRPVACRMGDRWMAGDLIPVLQEQGIRYDLTVEPGIPDHPPFDDPLATAWLPDYRRAPRAPYLPSAADFLVPESNPSREAMERAVWLVPLTTTEPPRWVPVRRFPFLLKASRPMNLVVHPREVWAHMAREIDRACAEPLVFVLRSGDLCQPGFLANFRYIAERLGRHPGLKHCRFTGVDAAVESFWKTQLQTA
jgi:hypothetical protein